MKTTHSSIGFVKRFVEYVPDDALVKTEVVTKKNNWVTVDGKRIKHKQTVTTITITTNEVVEELCT